MEDRIGRFARTTSGAESVPGKWRVSAGGAALNVARIAAACGARCRLATVLGEDETAAFLRAEARSAGVDLDAATHPGRSAGYTAFLQPDGTLVSALADMTILDEWQPGPEAWGVHKPAICVLDANFEPSVLSELAGAAPAPLAALTVSAAKAERLTGLLPGIETLFTNRAEACALLGRSMEPADAAAALRAAGVGRVCISDGPYPVAIADEDGPRTITPPTAPVRDTTGAGDALAGGALAALALGVPFAEAVRRGMEAAAAVLAVEGAWSDRLPALLSKTGKDGP